MKALPKTKLEKSIKPGTIWQLGNHRLVYGNCQDEGLIKKLISKDKINLILSDIPYGVAAVESKQNFKPLKKDKVILNDHIQSEAEYEDFNCKWLDKIIPFLADYNSFYIFNADKMVWSLKDALVKLKFKVAQLLIWVKSQAVVGRLDYAPQHELIIYGWYGKHRFRRFKDRSVLFYQKPQKNKLHPTTKPIGLIRRLILNSSNINEVVYDGFLGSGTTLLACEQTRRKCLAVEIDLEYCLTTIKRFERLTNIKAKII